MKRFLPRFLRLSFLFLLVLFFLALLVPCANCRTSAARAAEIRYKIQDFRAGLDAYHREYSIYPAGDLSALLATLRSQNPRALPFFELSLRDFDASGQFIDSFGTPFRLADTSPPQLISAGRDRKFGTDDDLR